LKNNKRGFTLIELLIVIALLGALAVGLLATVDPFEQLKKGTDTSRRNTVSEVYNSLIRYYSVKSSMPWSVDITAMSASNNDMTAASTGYLTKVIDAGELKPDFITLAGSGALDKIVLTSTGNRQNVSVCFLPESKSFLAEGNAKYNATGEPGTNCKSSEGGTQDCYWCIK
jgi:prepilin-type N-terminal cleavage/methylation domain-containing protein